MDVLTFGEALACFSRAIDVDAARHGYYARTVGGAEANTAVGLSRLGHDVAWVSRVAGDPLGDHVMSSLATEGVDLSHVVRDDDRQTGVMVKERYGPHDTSVHYYRRHSAATRLEPADVPDALLARARLVHLTGITLAIGDRPRALAHDLVDRANALGVEVSFDANYRPQLLGRDEARDQYAKVIPRVTHFLCNESEAHLITGSDDVDEAVDRLRRLGPPIVIVKRGADGAVADVEGVRFRVDAAPAPDPVDPVGAGDAFNAGWLHSRLEGLPTALGLDLAAFVAAAVVQHPGDYEGFPGPGVVSDWLATIESESVRHGGAPHVRGPHE